MDIYQLLYISTAVDSIKKADLDNILAVSHKNNPSRNITGILLFKGGLFIQLLEGSYDSVRQLYERISKDARHGDIKIAWERTSDNRLYGEWAMAYKEFAELDRPWVNQLLELINHHNQAQSSLEKLRQGL
jgi:hypothetical protein